MVVTLNGKGLISSLIQVALPRGVVVSMITLCVSQTEPLAKTPHFPIDLRADDQMPVILHQAIAIKVKLDTSKRFFQDVLERLIIAIFVEDRLTTIGAVEHVISEPRFVGSFWSAHPERLPRMQKRRKY